MGAGIGLGNAHEAMPQLRAEFKDKAELAMARLDTPGKKALAFLVAFLTAPLSLVALGIVGGIRAIGGFQKTLQIYKPNEHEPIDTRISRADLRQLTNAAPVDQGGLSAGAKRAMAMQALRAAGETEKLNLIDQIETDVLVRALNNLVEGRDDPFEEVHGIHSELKKDVLDAGTLNMVRKFKVNPEHAGRIEFGRQSMIEDDEVPKEEQNSGIESGRQPVIEDEEIPNLEQDSGNDQIPTLLEVSDSELQDLRRRSSDSDSFHTERSDSNSLQIELETKPIPSQDVGSNQQKRLPPEEEKMIRNFFAEVIFPSNPADEHQPSGERLKTLFISHPQVALTIYRHPESLEKAGILNPEQAQDLSSSFSQLMGVDLHKIINPKSISDEDVAGALETIPVEQFELISSEINSWLDNFDFKTEAGTERLAETIPDNAGGNFGTFMKRVFLDYFDNQATVDKRAAVASFLRESGAYDGDSKKLVALLKGAGPYMQKALQLCADFTLDKALKNDLGELKTGLSPIHPEIKKAIFAEIIEQSNGRILNIENIRTLGAASVGEALNAKITSAGPEGEAVTRNVIIKLLRPGIQQRAAREREFFERVAAEIPGMAGTFKGIADQVEQELDLSKEANNVRLAQVYNQGDDRVQAMRLIEGVEAMPGYMLVEKAPGAPIKKWFDWLTKVSGSEPWESKGGVHPMELGQKMREAIAVLAEKWLVESLYETGFYHGDLHSGNIMFSTKEPNLLTVIDMGNATTLTKPQQTAVFKMIAACAAQEATVFVENFESVLSGEGKRLMNDGNHRNLFMEAVGSILRSDNKLDAERAILQILVSQGKMPEEDLRKIEINKLLTPINVGDKIGLILEAANTLGLEIPATISNFSRSQLMLQEAMATCNELNKKMWGDNYSNARSQHEGASKWVGVNIEILKYELGEDSPTVVRIAEAYNRIPPDYQSIREIAQEPPERSDLPTWKQLKDKCTLAIIEPPSELRFDNIADRSIMDHKMQTFKTLFGDLFALAPGLYRQM